MDLKKQTGVSKVSRDLKAMLTILTKLALMLTVLTILTLLTMVKLTLLSLSGTVFSTLLFRQSEIMPLLLGKAGHNYKKFQNFHKSSQEAISLITAWVVLSLL